MQVMHKFVLVILILDHRLYDVHVETIVMLSNAFFHALLGTIVGHPLHDT
jgi:hypothetical protein